MFALLSDAVKTNELKIQKHIFLINVSRAELLTYTHARTHTHTLSVCSYVISFAEAEVSCCLRLLLGGAAG